MRYPTGYTPSSVQVTAEQIRQVLGSNVDGCYIWKGYSDHGPFGWYVVRPGESREMTYIHIWARVTLEQ